MYAKWTMALFILLNCSLGSEGRTIRTTTGKVRGMTVQLPDGEEAEAFLGIPFAEPPLGKLRFERPVPITPWEGVYNATFLPPPCYQNYTFRYYWTPDVDRMTEDCLYLNVWVPGSLQDTKPKVVFVWIYGGAFNVGSTELAYYNGALLANRGDMIVVTMNYRVGMFGFLTTPIPEAAGNMGNYDQLLALKWIKSNVREFGGDPDQITLAGESAGAMSAAMILLSPLSRGLVNRAILQSAGLIHPMAPILQGMMIKIADQIARVTGCGSQEVNITNNPKMIVDCLKDLPPNKISEAEGLIMKLHPITASPHAGDEYLGGRDPVDILKEGRFQEMEVLLGCNKDEGSNFLTFVAPEYFGIYGANAPILKKRMAKYVIRNIFDRTEQQNTKEIADYYVEGNGNRKQHNEIADDGTDYMKTAVYDSLGDYMILCPTVFHADLLSVRKKPVYFYIFSHRSHTSLNAEWMGATHFDEVQYVFGLPLLGAKNYSQDDQDVSRRMMDRWIAFVKTGNPNVEGEVEWPRYRWNNPLYLDINAQEEVKKKPDDYRCEFWRDRYRVTMDYFKSERLTSDSAPSPVVRKASFSIITLCIVLEIALML